MNVSQKVIFYVIINHDVALANSFMNSSNQINKAIHMNHSLMKKISTYYEIKLREQIEYHLKIVTFAKNDDVHAVFC